MRLRRQSFARHFRSTSAAAHALRPCHCVSLFTKAARGKQCAIPRGWPRRTTRRSFDSEHRKYTLRTVEETYIDLENPQYAEVKPQAHPSLAHDPMEVL